MVLKNHKVAQFEGRVKAAGCVCDYHGFDAEKFKYSYWKCAFGERNSFVTVYATLHTNDVDAVELPQKQLSFVANY